MTFPNHSYPNGGFERYFLKLYVAGYRARKPARYALPHDSYRSARKAEGQAHDILDAIRCQPLQELVLQRERQQLEAKLFGELRPYSPFG